MLRLGFDAVVQWCFRCSVRRLILSQAAAPPAIVLQVSNRQNLAEGER